jgi:DNA helicase-2/ATP-dependent DNA helicase PcrA
MSAEEYSRIVADNQVYSVWRRYQEKLTQSKALDFDDILLKTKELLEIPEVRQRYRKKFSYILIDEFQDTNKVQYDITKLLKGPEQKLCVVGDLDQAIYSFRGARPTILENLDQDFKNARVITLDRNYRSTKSILNYAKAIIEGNESKYRADLYTENEIGFYPRNSDLRSQ